MATTKDYLRLAILGGGSKGACISDTKVSISPNASAGQSSSYATTTAPFDGVVSFGLVATETNHNGAGPWFSVSGKSNKQNLNASWFQTGGSWSFIPCRKGEQITYGGSGVKFTVIDFYKSIGGGYKRYLKALVCNRFGGSLWLRLKTTSETLRKQVATLLHSVAKAQPTRLSSITEAGNGGASFLLGTGLCLLTLTTQTLITSISKIKQQVSNRVQQLLTEQQERVLYRAQKGIKSGITSGPILVNRKTQALSQLDSFRVWVASNNARMEVAA